MLTLYLPVVESNRHLQELSRWANTSGQVRPSSCVQIDVLELAIYKLSAGLRMLKTANLRRIGMKLSLRLIIIRS